MLCGILILKLSCQSRRSWRSLRLLLSPQAPYTAEVYRLTYLTLLLCKQLSTAQPVYLLPPPSHRLAAVYSAANKGALELHRFKFNLRWWGVTNWPHRNCLIHRLTIIIKGGGIRERNQHLEKSFWLKVCNEYVFQNWQQFW